MYCLTSTFEVIYIYRNENSTGNLIVQGKTIYLLQSGCLPYQHTMLLKYANIFSRKKSDASGDVQCQ